MNPANPWRKVQRNSSFKVMAIEIIELEESIFSDTDYQRLLKKAEEIADDADSFVPQSDRWRKPPRVKLTYGTFTFTLYAAATAAFWALAVPLFLGWTMTNTSNFTTRKDRRRRRTELCVRQCMTIIQNGFEELDYIDHRALEAPDEVSGKPKTRRKKRKFRSRA